MNVYHVIQRSGTSFSIRDDRSPKDMYEYEKNKGSGLSQLFLMSANGYAEVNPDGTLATWKSFS